MVRYIKCPRCELNYIDGDTQEYCDVCIAEMKGNKLQFADLEDEELEEALESEATELCPICGVNHIKFGETMCEECRAKSEYEEEEDIDPEKDEEWKNYLDDDTEDLSLDDTELDDEQLKEELEGDDDDEVEEGIDEDEFFNEEMESLEALGDEDFDDDDEDEDDDDDDLF